MIRLGDTNPKGNEMIKVMTGTMLRNAQVNVADVYCRPRRNKYCVSDALHRAENPKLV